MFAYFPADLIRNDKCNVLQVPLLSYEIPQSQCTVNKILHRDLWWEVSLQEVSNDQTQMHTAHRTWVWHWGQGLFCGKWFAFNEAVTARLDFHFHGMEDDVCFGQFDVFSLDYGHSAKSVNGGDWVEACRIRIVK